MPQATDELRAKMKARFGNEIDPDAPIAWLEQQGWKLRRDFYWDKPSKDHTPTDDELDCLDFLIDEWDFGGIAKEKP